MRIVEMKLPETSGLYTLRNTFDYTDSFGGVVDDWNNTMTMDALVDAFLKPPPPWVLALIKLRNQIAACAGLKRGTLPKSTGNSIRHTPGSQAGFFKCFECTENEVILGENDKHLDFKVSILRQTDAELPHRKTVVISTVVHYNNWMGKVYFFFVKPFHQLIVRSMLQRDFQHF